MRPFLGGVVVNPLKRSHDVFVGRGDLTRGVVVKVAAVGEAVGVVPALLEPGNKAHPLIVALSVFLVDLSSDFLKPGQADGAVCRIELADIDPRFF